MILPSTRKLSVLLGFLAAFVAVMNFSTYFLYNRAKAHLDNELGERLRAIATTLSHAVEHSSGMNPGIYDRDAGLVTMLRLVRSENLLSNIVILTPDGTTVVDIAGFSPPGETNPFVDLDYGAVTLAGSGIPSYTRLYQSGGVFMKGAYAPIMSADDEVAGILGVEAGAGFFTVLRALSRAIVLIGVVSAAVVIVLAVFFYRHSRSLDRAQTAVLQGENLATMGRMVAGVAHEIRNPLSIIKTSAERLAKKYNPGDETFGYISEEVDELNRILTGYLSFARAEKTEFRPHSLQRILRRCFLILDGEIQAKRVRVVDHTPGEDVTVIGDDKRIQQAFLNVLINACQAVDEEGTIEVSLGRSARRATVTIKDDGPGIGEKELKEVLKPFFTTKENGSGLGLTIVKSIVEDHGGNLDISSTPGRGTSVEISLPRALGGGEGTRAAQGSDHG